MAERGLRSEGCRRRASRSPPLHEPGKRREARARAPSREAPPRPQTQGQRGNARRRKGKLREKRGEPAPARPPGEDGRLRRATRERTALGAPGADAGVSTAPWKGRAGEAETPGRGERGKAENRKSGGHSPGGTGAPMVSAAGRRRGGSGGARRPSRGPAECSAGPGRPPVPGRPQDAGTWAPRADESPSGLEAQRQWGGRQDSNPDSLLKQINIEETVKKMVSQEPVLRELWVRPSPKNQGDRRGGEEQVGHQSPGWQ